MNTVRMTEAERAYYQAKERVAPAEKVIVRAAKQWFLIQGRPETWSELLEAVRQLTDCKVRKQ